jgi:hypothetical protein
VTALGFVMAIVGGSLAVGIRVGVWVYRPAEPSRPYFKAVARAAMALAIIGVLVAVIGVATGA